LHHFRFRGLVFSPFFIYLKISSFLSFRQLPASSFFSSNSLPVRSSQGILYILVILSVIFGSFCVILIFFFLNFVIIFLFPFSFRSFPFFADGTAKGRTTFIFTFISIVTTCDSITPGSSHGVSLFFSRIFFSSFLFFLIWQISFLFFSFFPPLVPQRKNS